MIRILIVDDQKSVRENIKVMLSSEPNFEIVGTAENGHQGIKLAETLAPDVILMDLEMPKLDGLTTTKLISQENSATNIIILTIKDQDELLIQALNAGARGYLLKSSENQEIVNTINLVYQGNKSSEHQVNSVKTIEPISESTNHDHQKQFATEVNGSSNSSYNSTSNINNINNSKVIEADSDLETLGNRIQPTEAKFNFTTFLSIIKRRYPPALMGFFGVLVGAGLYLIFAKRAYQATASIVLQNRQESVSELGKDLSSIGDSREYSPLASQVELIQSKSVLKSALKYAMENEDKTLDGIDIDREVEIIEKNLNVSIIPNTNIIEISYVDYEPKFASILLNEIISTVKRKNADSIRAEASSVKQFLEAEVAKQAGEVNRIKVAENNYREQQGIVSLDNQTKNLVNNLNQLQMQRQELLTVIKEQESKVNNLERVAKVDSAEAGFIEGKIGQDRQLEELRGRLIEIEAELATARSNFTENNPVIINLAEEKENITQLLQEQIDLVLGEGVISASQITKNNSSQAENGIGEAILEDLIANQVQLDADRDKIQVIEAEITNIKDQIALLPNKVQSLTDIVAQQEQASESLQFLQRKLEEARIAEAQLIGNFQIVEKASIPSSPYTPNTIVVMAIASILATSLMMAIILLLERIDRTLYDAEEIEQSLNLPFLNALPSLPQSGNNLSRIVSFLNDRTLYEPYRFLLKRLESYRRGNNKVIVVTSATTEEGKSTVASHLGAVSAMLSKRTLIIDAHLHSPKQHYLLAVQSQEGLKEVATRGLDLNQAIQPTKIKNLSVLAAGNSTSDSWMILESPLMQKIIQEASVQYDLIIIDTPPVSDSCDAYTLSKYSNGLIVVTRPFHTTKDILEQTVLDLKRNKAPIIGFVINNVEQQKSTPDSVLKNLKYELPALSSTGVSRSSRSNFNGKSNGKEVRRP